MDEHLRVGDLERERVTHELAEHYAAGRLSQEEFDHRAGVVLRARTGLDLKEVLADLPSLQRSEPPAPVPVSARGESDIQRKARLIWQSAGLAPWAIFAVFFVLIWVVTGAGYFWPIWPIMGWGIGVAVTGVMARTLPELYLERQEMRARHGAWCAMVPRR